MKSLLHLVISALLAFTCQVSAEEKPVPGLNPAEAVLDPACGTWSWFGGEAYFIIEMNGTVTQPKRRGNWICKNPLGHPRNYLITWDGEKVVDNFRLSSDGMNMDGDNQFGTKLHAARVGPPPPIGSQMDSLIVDADGNRKWTQAKSGLQIIGRMVEKTPDGARIARKDNGKGVNLVATTLSTADQYFIRYWVAPEAQVTARVREFGIIGWKKVGTVIQAGEAALLVEVTGEKPVPHPFIAGLPRPPFFRIVPAGTRLEFEFAAGSTYSVRATANGRPVDAETDERKTGL
jgi:hypothetical protein